MKKKKVLVIDIGGTHVHIHGIPERQPFNTLPPPRALPTPSAAQTPAPAER